MIDGYWITEWEKNKDNPRIEVVIIEQGDVDAKCNK